MILAALTLSAFTIPPQCVRVVDGDTIKDVCEHGRIRIANIATCETKGHEPDPTCTRAQARASRDALVRVIGGRQVRVTPERPCSRREKRIVGRVSVNGRDVGEIMVRQGYARWFVCRGRG